MLLTHNSNEKVGTNVIMSDFCNQCGEPLGFILNYEFFCYNCSIYKKLEIKKCLNRCETELTNLREQFRNTIVNENIERHFYNFMNMSELACKFHSSPDPYELNSKIGRAFVYLDISKFVVTSIGLNWILEDLNYIGTELPALYSEIPLEILKNWLILFRKKIFLENGLGFYIKNEIDNYFFYYTKEWVSYGKSLSQFGFIEPEFLLDDLDLIHGSLDQMEKIEQDKEGLKKFVKKDFSLRLISALYDVYPNRTDRLFSFDDILYDDTGMIPYALQRIYNYYDDKRSHDLDEFKNTGKPLFFKTNYLSLTQNIPELPWFDRMFNSLFLTSQFNPTSFPMLIKIKQNVYILPYRTRLAHIFMNEKLNHMKSHGELSKQYELRFQNLVMNILSRNGVKIQDPISNIDRINIIEKKKNTFEIDILATLEDKILIIECKSIRMAPFYNLIPYRIERENQFLHFSDQFLNRIRPWIYENLRNTSESKVIEIICRQRYKDKIILSFPQGYHNLRKENIIGLYITQLNEKFKTKSNIMQIYFQDLKEVVRLFSSSTSQ
ncbi:hypothetical protein LCGC14_0819350 [marine sediment metagenome]|uniref:NERD domain-containing protein n=1 Tax=marine sediment metagenome TaxID=412755 RepID=A0A0F9S4D4_9ZZZZ